MVLRRDLRGLKLSACIGTAFMAVWWALYLTGKVISKSSNSIPLLQISTQPSEDLPHNYNTAYVVSRNTLFVKREELQMRQTITRRKEDSKLVGKLLD